MTVPIDEAPLAGATGPLRVFHFDIPTAGNFGDLVLFEAVRQVFNSYIPPERARPRLADSDDPAGPRPGSGAGFSVFQTRNLRRRVDAAIVDRINQTADLVVIGGGGLFQRDAVADSASGWQWNIPRDVLERFEVPLVVFAAGNNQFPGQGDFVPPFREHLAATARESILFGLRSAGSLASIATYLPGPLAKALCFQPCPTAFASSLYPDLAARPRDTGRRIAVQCSIDGLQRAAGFDADRIYAAEISVLRRLAREGWEIDSVPHHPLDLEFATVLGAEGFLTRARPLRGDPSAATAGLAEFAETPIVLATRGHAQVIPFGMGAIPIALDVHAKVRWFAADIDHPELVIDPQADTFAEDLYRLINTSWERQEELRADFARRRRTFGEITEANLAATYARLRHAPPTTDDDDPRPTKTRGVIGGRPASTGLSVVANAYSSRERRLGRESLTNAIAADDAEELADVQLDRARAALAAHLRRAKEGRCSDTEFLAALRRRARTAKREGRRFEAVTLAIAILAVAGQAARRRRRAQLRRVTSS
ncbi:MAG: hypothetical protein LBK59_07725 [Bifidobacteriaceae bacterium]|nr:hypothetical protein [Bifidobacteriaceae bacterium]